jgi:septal ring factor EnvC (AmiA/AmiB activator)
LPDNQPCDLVSQRQQKETPMSLCSVCQRRDSAAITTALRHGEPVRALARRYKIPKTTMLRHARHVPQLTEKESPPMERPTAESPELVDDVEMALGQLASQLVEVRSQLARTQAQLAGINREFATWRTEQEAQRAQCTADHMLAEQLRACIQVLQTDDGAWRVLESILRGDGHNGRGPLLQQLRRLVGRKVLTLLDH